MFDAMITPMTLSAMRFAWAAASAALGCGLACGGAGSGGGAGDEPQVPVVVAVPADVADLDNLDQHSESPDPDDPVFAGTETTAAEPAAPPKRRWRAPPSGSNVKHIAIVEYKEAMKAFKMKDYANALTGFENANAAYPGAAPKHKIAVCLDKLGRRKEAAAAYQTFIDAYPSQKYQQRIDAARERIKQLIGRP